MKVLILAGGRGTRISEETDFKPKPMVEIGGKPILWHVMKIYSQYGFNEFVVLTGYKGYSIKEYFANYFLHQSDVTFDLSSNQVTVHHNKSEPWKVTVLDTGHLTMTGGRIKRAKTFIENDPFLLTYGDGVSDIDLKALVALHKKHGKAATVTTIQPEGRFGAIEMNPENRVLRFREKPQGAGAWINGGFFVCEPRVLNEIEGDSTIFEREPLENLASKEELFAYKHEGFWKCMDTLRDKIQLNEMWESGHAPWKAW